MSPSKADKGPKLSSSYNSLRVKGLATGWRAGIGDRPAEFCNALGRSPRRKRSGGPDISVEAARFYDFGPT